MAKTLEVIEHHDPTGEEIVYRFPPEGSAEIKLGAQLVVHESRRRCSSGTAERSTSSGPAVTRWRPRTSRCSPMLLSLPFGGTSPFRVAVVFVNKRTFLDQKWGTREPVVFRDSELGIVRLRAFGNYAYRIADSQLFINTVVGSQGLFRHRPAEGLLPRHHRVPAQRSVSAKP